MELEDKIILRNQLALLIRQFRELRGISQTELANKIGINLNTIIRIEQGKFSINAELLLLILKNLECTIVVKEKKFKIGTVFFLLSLIYF
jgi:transcriptional regulator with XRE-family HTH domain